MYASNFREMARNALRGKWKKMAWLTFLASLLGAGTVGSSSGMSFTSSDFEDLLEGQIPPEAVTALVVFATIVTLISLWTIFMGSFVRVGQVSMINRMIDGESPRAGMLFPKGIYWKSVGLNFMRSLFVFLWSLLLVIPGIIASFSYAMADYMLATHPEMGVMEALRESKRLMKGRKWRLFCLELSFIGWGLLTMVPAWVLSIIGGLIVAFVGNPNKPDNTGAILIFIGMSFIGILISMIAMMFVYAYLDTSVVAFFRDADRAGQWRDEAREGEEYARAAYGEDRVESTIASAMPHLGDAAPVEPVLSSDESVAKDVFMQHKCSYALMEKAGLLEEYKALKLSTISEARWKRDYADRLMRRFDQDPSVLDDILALCAEYAMDDLLTRALQRIERHLRQQTLSDADILNMCGRVLTLLDCGAFADNSWFIVRRKEQITGMADQLEARLSESDPDGSWRESLEAVRNMCQ